MAAKNFHVKLAGKAQLHDPRIELDNMLVNIWSIDGGCTWENKNTTVEVESKMDIFMSCKAISGTEWAFTITNIDTNRKAYYENGETGEPLISQGGKRIANYSERKETVPI